jgi:hypothetical protein
LPYQKPQSSIYAVSWEFRGAPHAEHNKLLKQIEALPAERIAEVEDFVAFIASREQERSLTHAAALASAKSFAAIWNNPEDDAYDVL